MKQYLRYRCWDFILCIFISIGLIFNVLSGFEINDVVSRMPMLIICVILLTFLYFLAAINRKTTIIGIIVGVILFIGCIIIVRSMNLSGSDEKMATQIFYIVIGVFSLFVFLACRTRIGIVVLFLIGNIIHAGASFLQYPCELWAYILFLIGMGLMMFYRVYIISVMHSHTGKIRFEGFMLQNALVCGISFILALTLFIGIIKPLNPPTDELKLIERLMSFEVLEKIGVSTVLVQVDKDKLSHQETQDELATDQQDENENDDNQGKSPQNQNRNPLNSMLDTVADHVEKAKAITYVVASYWYIGVILIIVLIGFMIWLRQYLRRKWLDEIDKLPRSEAIINLYTYFMFGLSKAGCAKAKNLTLDEFQIINAEQLCKFNHENVDFMRLTDVYRKVYYGRQMVSEEEYNDYRLYYSTFHKNICKVVGKLRYMYLYFRL